MGPLVSILLPCYNAEKYLEHSLTAILNQEYKNVEIICMNDGSTDSTLNILKTFQKKDARMVIVNSATNVGLIETLNNSFSCIKGVFFARMDADDYCPPDRIIRQVNYLLKNPEATLVSSGYTYFYENNHPGNYIEPIATLPGSIKFVSLFSTPMAHAAVMGRSALIKSGVYFYDKNYPHAEDFELFSRLAWQNIRLCNIKESLYWVRLNPQSVSALNKSEQLKTNVAIAKRNLAEFFGVKEAVDEKILKIMLNRMNTEVSRQEIKEAFSLLKSYSALIKVKLTLSEDEKSEIHVYLKIHRLNILIQANKLKFRAQKFRAFPFVISSITLISFNQILPLFKKIMR